MKKLLVKETIEKQEYDLLVLSNSVQCVITKDLYEDAIACNQPTIDFIGHKISGLILARFSYRFAGRNAGYFEFKWYSSWWQELRDKILPEWYLKKYPSKKEIKQKSQAVVLYPTVRIAEQNHYPFYIWS